MAKMQSYRENNTTKKHAISGDPLAEIYNEGFWRIHKVSPLYNLQYNVIKLKQYSSKIRQSLVSAVHSSSRGMYVVQMAEQVNLKYCEYDASALTINVLTTDESNNKSKIVYSALLLSWGVSTTLDNTTHLPYMLERGEQRVGTAVRTTLQTIFDCNIKQYCFTQRHLLQLGFNFVDNDSSRSIDPFTLTYRTSQVDHKDKIIVSMELGDVAFIWNRIKEVVENKSELITLSYQMLQNQIFDMSGIDITVLELCEIQLPRAGVKSNGVVKMKTPEIVNCVFSVLNEFSNIYSVDIGSSPTQVLTSGDDSTQDQDS